jgi:hypothetical protein
MYKNKKARERERERNDDPSGLAEAAACARVTIRACEIGLLRGGAELSRAES